MKKQQQKILQTTPKILFFEGAGCVPCGEVENCRIRTAFCDDSGKGIYLEILGLEPNIKKKVGYRYIGVVWACHYLETEAPVFAKPVHSITFEYTKENILQFVNNLGFSFDKIVVLPTLGGYHVFKEKVGVNFGDEFVFDQALTERREQIYSYYYNLEKSEGKEFPNFSMWVDEEDPALLHLLRHFPGYNKHWIMDATKENWLLSVKETPLHSPGYHGIAS